MSAKGDKWRIGRINSEAKKKESKAWKRRKTEKGGVAWTQAMPIVTTLRTKETNGIVVFNANRNANDAKKLTICKLVNFD